MAYGHTTLSTADLISYAWAGLVSSWLGDSLWILDAVSLGGSGQHHCFAARRFLAQTLAGASLCGVFPCSPCACLGFFMILQLLLKNMHVRLIDDSTVAMDVMQTKMDGCMVKMRRSLKCFAQSVRLEMCYLYITLNMLCETQAASYEQHCDYHSNYD